MKFTVKMKCPDALERAIEEAAEDEVGDIGESEEADIEYERLVEVAKKAAAKWFKWGEYIEVSIDTDKETCVVKRIA